MPERIAPGNSAPHGRVESGGQNASNVDSARGVNASDSGVLARFLAGPIDDSLEDSADSARSRDLRIRFEPGFEFTRNDVDGVTERSYDRVLLAAGAVLH